MNLKFVLITVALAIMSCSVSYKKEEQKDESSLPIIGTWKLLSGTLIENGDTLVTDYTQGRSFIKIINATHFAFTLHDLNHGKDSTAVFSSGAGRYELNDSLYTEHLEYCTDRSWEGHDFTFMVTIQNDTLIQSGVEKIESQGIDRMNIEKYIRIN
jgi:hypothetical protein